MAVTIIDADTVNNLVLSCQVGGIYYRLFCSDYIIGSMEELMEKFKEFLAGYKNNFEKLVHPNEMKEYNAMLAQVELKVKRIE